MMIIQGGRGYRREFLERKRHQERSSVEKARMEWNNEEKRLAIDSHYVPMYVSVAD